MQQSSSAARPRACRQSTAVGRGPGRMRHGGSPVCRSLTPLSSSPHFSPSQRPPWAICGGHEQAQLFHVSPWGCPADGGHVCCCLPELLPAGLPQAALCHGSSCHCGHHCSLPAGAQGQAAAAGSPSSSSSRGWRGWRRQWRRWRQWRRVLPGGGGSPGWWRWGSSSSSSGSPACPGCFLSSSSSSSPHAGSQ